MNQDNSKYNIKIFLIKLFSISLAIIIVINIIYNFLFADKIETINKFLTLNNKENVELVKDKIRLEIKKGLDKEQVLTTEDKKLLYKFYKKIKKEFYEIE